MPSELEHRLTRALAAGPHATPAAEDAAREAALAALGPPSGTRRPAAWLIVAAAAAAAVMTGVALAATRAISPSHHQPIPSVGPGSSSSSTRVPTIDVPEGAAGFGVQVGGRLWVATPRGLALRGVRLGAAAISPQAFYAVGQTGRRLNAVSIADRHVAWSVPLHGDLVAAAWSPYPIRIAYVIRHRDGRSALHSIWGNGTNDRIIGPAAPVMPAWMWDSLALAYVAPAGGVMLSTVGAAPRRLNGSSACGGGRITELAFGPRSSTLAEATTASQLILVDTRRPGRLTCIPTGAPAVHLRWLSATDLVYGHPASADLTRIALHRHHVIESGTVTTPGAVLGVASSPDDHRLAIALRAGTRLRLLVIEAPALGHTGPARARDRLRLRPPASAAVRISWS